MVEAEKGPGLPSSSFDYPERSTEIKCLIDMNMKIPLNYSVYNKKPSFLARGGKDSHQKVMIIQAVF